MYLGQNLQHLRRTNGNMTQERLAQRMGVSRQTVSKWESGESAPEIGKLIELCEVFSCTLDALLRENLTARSSIYLPVRLERILPFRYASYTVWMPSPPPISAGIFPICLRSRSTGSASTAIPLP